VLQVFAATRAPGNPCGKSFSVLFWSFGDRCHLSNYRRGLLSNRGYATGVCLAV